MTQTKKIALTGMMGAGKSSVIALLKQMGIEVLDCDEINRELIRKGARGYERIRERFGDDILDAQGNLDTKKMSALIFSDPHQKKCLEHILHPMIREEIIAHCEASEERIIVIEVPLLFEVHWESYFDEIWVVVCERETLLYRLETYRHIPKAEALRRLAHQMSEEEKCKGADVILHNDGDQEELRTQIVKELERLWEE